MTNIIGLDVGRGSAVLCCLSEFPSNILQHFKLLQNQGKFYQVDCSRAGVDKLLSLKPDGIVLEPSGHWYSHFWVTVAKRHGIKIYWIGHTALKGQRTHYGFTNKRDTEDALCLAASYFDTEFVDIHGRKRFLNYYQDELIVRLRELFHEKEQLQKLRTNLITQLRQRLAYEFPEAVKHTMQISKVKGYTPFIYWLAHSLQAPRYDNKYRQSIAPDLGIAISDYTRAHAQMIIEIEKRLTQTVTYINDAIALPQFEPYHRVFDKFGFGVNCRALLLFHVYPIERFLVDGKPWIEYVRSREKLQKRDRSLRKFQAYLGLSFKYEISGDGRKRKYHGSSLVRSHLYAWSVCMIAPKKNVIGSDISEQLSSRYQELRNYIKGKDGLTRILFKTTRMLFYELVNEICGGIS